MLIGILALQGAFAEHAAMLKLLGVESFEIRKAPDAARYMDGLILPGGESSVMGKLLHDLDLFEPLTVLINSGLPVLGTCAGMLLLAKNILNNNAKYFASMNITVRRNAYGRQLASFTAEGLFDGKSKITMPFIRAPYIETCGPGVQILAETNGHITAARENNQLACAFHPELTGDATVHKYFINMIN